MDVLRTPDERFAHLPGWPFAPRYRDDLPGFEGLRVHHVDEGDAAAPVTANGARRSPLQPWPASDSPAHEQG
jgi:hypothetical protein